MPSSPLKPIVRLALVAALATSLLPTLMTPGAAAPASPRRGSTIASATDEPDDVKIFPVKGLGARERQSVDIREVSVVRRPDSVRFVVRLESITRAEDFDQMAFFRLRPTADSTATWTVDIGMSPQTPALSYANFFLDDSGTRYEVCDPLSAVVLRGRDTVRLDVPNRCLPDRAARIKVVTLTGYFRGDAGPWSKDSLRIPGAFLLL